LALEKFVKFVGECALCVRMCGLAEEVEAFVRIARVCIVS